MKIWKLKLGYCRILKRLSLNLGFWKVEKAPLIEGHVVHSPFFFPFSFFFLSFFSSFSLLPHELSLLPSFLHHGLSKNHFVAVVQLHAPASRGQRGRNTRPQLAGGLDVDVWSRRGAWERPMFPSGGSISSSRFWWRSRSILWLAQSPLHNGVLIFWRKWLDYWQVFSCKRKLCKLIRIKQSLILR